jgi:hypothetical protein
VELPSAPRVDLKPWLLGGLLVIVVLAGLLGLGYWYYVARDIPTQLADPAEHFKYGSIGTEAASGIPFLVWKVLPAVCAGKLPGNDYASLGFVYEPGHDRPIGMPLRIIGIPRVGLNCAVCHTGFVRLTPDGERRILLGMPAQQLNLQAYARFLWACAEDERFTPDNVLAAIRQTDQLSPIDSLVYRYLIIPKTKSGLLEQRDRFSWFNDRPPFGPGRVDTFTSYKVMFGFDVSKDHSIGIVDIPSLWNQGVRVNYFSQWDGNNNSLSERNKSASFGAGTTPETIDIPSLDRVEAWIKVLPPPPYPFPVDAQLAAKGEPIYKTYCAACHDVGGAQIGQVTPVAEIGTDDNRLVSFTAELVDKLNTLGTGYPWRFTHFRKTNGYANMPLDAVWARAPYLHNGSVPSMRDLLEPPEKRTPVFYRGYDVYDPQNMGFVSAGAEAERVGFKYDTSVPGNGNGGHLYGTSLSPADKSALIEYLKTQ